MSRVAVSLVICAALAVSRLATGGEASQFVCRGIPTDAVLWSRDRVVFEEEAAANEYSHSVPDSLRAALSAYYDAYAQEDLDELVAWCGESVPDVRRRLESFFSKVEMRCYYFDFRLQERRSAPAEFEVWTKVIYAQDGSLVEGVVYNTWARTTEGWGRRCSSW